MATASPARRPLRILFSMRNFWYVKLFDSVIRQLAARGHHVHILAEQGEHNERSRDWNEAAAALSREHANVSFAWAPRPVEDDWVDLRIMTRLGLDHLRFLEPDYANAPKLASRARSRTPGFVVRLADAPLLSKPAGRRLLARLLRAAERVMPVDPGVARCIEAHGAQLILITPLLTLGSEQMDVLRTGRRLGIQTALCVGSWDHLSSKALIRDLPHRVFVWNELQRREAVTLHHVPADRVVVTGAQCFDQWFGRAPSLDRDAFCGKVGLDPARPYVLYVCSALFEGSPNEGEFVRSWVRALRASGDPVLERAGVLIRPHPKRASEWDDIDLTGLEHVAMWPARAAAPFDAAGKADYFDSMFHAAVTVGLNTSALIESGIIGRPVHTILLPEFYENQEGTLHFRYLLELGLLRAARDMPSHLARLSASLAASDPSVHHNTAFVETFVRPRGLAADATPIFADEVESLARQQPVPVPEALWIPLLRLILMPVAKLTRGTFAEQIGRERRRRAKRRERDRRAAALREQRAAEKASILAERQARHAAAAQARREHALRLKAEELAAKARVREQKQRVKERAKAGRRRHKQWQTIAARLAAYGRRLVRPFSITR